MKRHAIPSCFCKEARSAFLNLWVVTHHWENFLGHSPLRGAAQECVPDNTSAWSHPGHNPRCTLGLLQAAYIGPVHAALVQGCCLGHPCQPFHASRSSIALPCSYLMWSVLVADCEGFVGVGDGLPHVLKRKKLLIEKMLFSSNVSIDDHQNILKQKVKHFKITDVQDVHHFIHFETSGNTVLFSGIVLI